MFDGVLVDLRVVPATPLQLRGCVPGGLHLQDLRVLSTLPERLMDYYAQTCEDVYNESLSGKSNTHKLPEIFTGHLMQDDIGVINLECFGKMNFLLGIPFDFECSELSIVFFKIVN